MSIKNESFDSFDLESRDQFPDHPHGPIAKSPKAHYNKEDGKYFQGDQSLSNIDGLENSAEKAKRKAKIKSLKIEKKKIEVEIDLFRKTLARKQRDEDHEKELNRKAFMEHKESLDLEMESTTLKAKIAQADLEKAKQSNDSEKIAKLEQELETLTHKKADIELKRLKEIEEYHQHENARKKIAKAAVQEELQKQIQLERRRVEIERELDELQVNDHLVWRDYTPLTSVKQKDKQKTHNKKSKKPRSDFELDDSMTPNGKHTENNNSQTVKNIIGVILAIVFIIVVAVLLRIFILSRPVTTPVPVAASPLGNGAYVPPPLPDYYEDDFDAQFDDEVGFASFARPEGSYVRPVVIAQPLITNPQNAPAVNPQVLELMTNTSGNNGNPATTSNVDSSGNNNVNSLVRQHNQINNMEAHKNGVNVLGFPSGNGAMGNASAPSAINNYNYPVEETNSFDVNTYDDKSKKVFANDIQNVDMANKNTNFLNQEQSNTNLYSPLTINQQEGTVQQDNGLLPNDGQAVEKNPSEEEQADNDQNIEENGQKINQPLAKTEIINQESSLKNQSEKPVPISNSNSTDKPSNGPNVVGSKDFSEYLQNLQNNDAKEAAKITGVDKTLTKDVPKEFTKNDPEVKLTQPSFNEIDRQQSQNSSTLGQTDIPSDSTVIEDGKTNEYDRIKVIEEEDLVNQGSNKAIGQPVEPASPKLDKTGSTPSKADNLGTNDSAAKLNQSQLNKEESSSIDPGETELNSSSPLKDTNNSQPANSIAKVSSSDKKTVGSLPNISEEENDDLNLFGDEPQTKNLKQKRRLLSIRKSS